MKPLKIQINRVLFIGIMLFISCSSIDSQMKSAEKVFIKNASYMTERDALSEEIDYYKKPEITLKRHTRSLTGKDLIRECNLVEKDNQKSINAIKNNERMYGITRDVSDIKSFALDNPNKIVANEFEFSGIFTHYGDDKYGKKSSRVILISKIERYIVTPIY